MTNAVEKIGAQRLGGKAVEVGQWYWVKDDEDKTTWLGCVVHIGSNYVQLESPWYNQRVHFDEMFDVCRYEDNPQAVIQKEIGRCRLTVAGLLDDIKQLTARLGIAPVAVDQQAADNALVVISGRPDVNGYKKALVKAKDKTLPDLFRKVKDENERLAAWMTAETLPLQAQADGLQAHIEVINSRIFNISLYAGLTEQVVKCRHGRPADYAEPLHVMQRKLYMDEECLLDYQHGGMEFADIGAFDKWLAAYEHMTRILPFPRTIVAMQVRRRTKTREQHDLRDALINIGLKKADAFTFLYVRNGNQLWRMDCDLDFGDLIFPGKDVTAGGEPLMMEMFGSHFKENMITRGEYDARVAKMEENNKKHDDWKAANPDKEWIENPYHRDYMSYNYEPFDQSSTYYDEGQAFLKKQIDHYNRIALIIQGLFDRSPVLHPHPPVKTWDADSFERSVKLVYDGSAALYHGEPPDFEAYRQRLNASIDSNSVVSGQEVAWMRREAERENQRQRNDWRNRNPSHYKFYRPDGDPGPGVVSTMRRWRRGEQAVFKWLRTRSGWRHEHDLPSIPCSLSVPAGGLLNVSAYQPGDYKQFFADPRTRENYLQWAPLLLAAEEYYAGNVVLGAGSKDNKWLRKSK